MKSLPRSLRTKDQSFHISGPDPSRPDVFCLSCYCRRVHRLKCIAIAISLSGIVTSGCATDQSLPAICPPYAGIANAQKYSLRAYVYSDPDRIDCDNREIERDEIEQRLRHAIAARFPTLNSQKIGDEDMHIEILIVTRGPCEQTRWEWTAQLDERIPDPEPGVPQTTFISLLEVNGIESSTGTEIPNKVAEQFWALAQSTPASSAGARCESDVNLDAIREAVFRHQVKQLPRGSGGDAGIYFFSLADFADPPPLLLAKFDDLPLPVKPLSAAFRDHGRVEGCENCRTLWFDWRDSATGLKGEIYQIFSIRIKSDQFVEVHGRHGAVFYLYELQRTGGKWRVVHEESEGAI